MRKFLTVSVVAVAVLLGAAQVAKADQVSTEIINPSHSPGIIQRCQVDASEYSPQAWVNIQNKTHHQLITADVRYSFYDADKALFGQITMTYRPDGTIASGDIQQFSGYLFGMQHSEPLNVTSYVTCRFNAATFTGQKSWHYGQPWPESLISSSGTSAPQESVSVVAGGSGEAPPKLAIQVLSAWHDPAPQYQSGIYVHDRVSIAGADRDATVHPHDFVLKVLTASGQTQSVHGLSKSAPTYLKPNYATNQSAWTPEVALDEDLGAHGSIDVPAHGSATAVVTFYIPTAIDTSRLSDVSYL